MFFFLHFTLIYILHLYIHVYHTFYNIITNIKALGINMIIKLYKSIMSSAPIE